MSSTRYALPGGAALAAFGIFAALAQSHLILVPYFTPGAVEVQGLVDSYQVGGLAKFAVVVNGYGSNCNMFEVEVVHEGERASYYKRVDDCRSMDITHGQYNFTRSFEYGPEILEKTGSYTLEIKFEDLVDGTTVATTRTFEVLERPNRNLTLDLNESLRIEGNPR